MFRKTVAATFITFISMALFGCAGLNPNPGERTSDVLWSKYQHDDALKIIVPAAEKGVPWAQLRLGIAYELGKGVSKNIPKALYWYKHASVHSGDDKWSEGLLVGAAGQSGYFNQNSDAMVAQYQIANIYLRGEGIEKNSVSAYLWAKYLAKKSAHKDVFFCCEYEGGRWILQKDIQKIIAQIEMELDPGQKATAEQLLTSWKPSLD